MRQRLLDRGNPNPGNLGIDFGVLGMEFWAAVRARSVRSSDHQKKLQTLCDWRNAIAHQDFSRLQNPALGLGQVRSWRRACNRLARTFDAVVGAHVSNVVGARPW